MTKDKDLDHLIQKFFQLLDKESKVTIDKKKNWLVSVDTPNAGLLIGRDGETLAVIQYLVRSMVAHMAKDYTPLTVDIGGYKQKKNQELEELALAVAENVKNSHYSQELRPMSANERRIVHSILADFKGVKTESVGEGELRRVKVEPEEE